MNSPAVLLIGGPEAGKSNFLFRAWTEIDSGSGKLEKDGLPLDADYLQTGAEFQLGGRFAGRTSQEVHVFTRIPVKLRQDPAQTATLVVPDVLGEEVDKIYKTRRWDDKWEELIRQDTGYLLFARANSDQTIAPLDWITCHKLYGSVPAVDASAAQSETQAAIGTSTATPTPTQVVLVDWLQFILKAVRDRAKGKARPRVGLIVTAWDSLPKDADLTPSDWIRENLPLLHQYVMTNGEAFEFAFFGSSIFAGDPDMDQDFADVLRKSDPRTFGFILSEESQTADFTVPLAWALGW